MTTIDPSNIKAGDTVTLTISDPEMVPFEVHGGVYDGPEGLMAGAWPIIGHPHVTLTDHQPAEPEWKPGTTGTATVEDASGIDGTWIRSHSGRLYFATHEGGTSTGNLADVDNVTDFVPDDAEALRVRLADAERALAEILPVINELDDGSVYDGSYAQILSDGIGRLRREVARARQLATDRLGGMHANGAVIRKTAEALGIDAALARRHGDAFMAEVGRLRAAALPTDLTKCICPWDSEDRGGGHSEIVGEYEPACPVHSTHVYDPLQGMWVERAPRTLPTQERVADAIRSMGNRFFPDKRLRVVDPNIAAAAVLALVEQGGAAPKVEPGTRRTLQAAVSQRITGSRPFDRAGEILDLVFEHLGIEVRDS